MDIESIEEQFGIKFIMLSIVGSKMWGLDNEDSDTDYAGIYILKNPADYCSLDGIENTISIQSKEFDLIGYELKHFCNLLVKSNPSTHDILFSDSKVIKNDDLLTDLIKIQNTIPLNLSDKPYLSMLKTNLMMAKKNVTLKLIINILRELYLHVKIRQGKSLCVKRNLKSLLEFYSHDEPLIKSLILLKTETSGDPSLVPETLNIVQEVVNKHIIELHDEILENLFKSIKKIKEGSLENQKKELKTLIYNTRK